MFLEYRCFEGISLSREKNYPPVKVIVKHNNIVYIYIYIYTPNQFLQLNLNSDSMTTLNSSRKKERSAETLSQKKNNEHNFRQNVGFSNIRSHSGKRNKQPFKPTKDKRTRDWD